MTSQSGVLTPKWYSPAEVAVLLGYGLSKVKMLIATRELRSIKDGKYRRVLPEWVDDYIATRVDQQQDEVSAS
jgi:excisionase family DNA binding protein